MNTITATSSALSAYLKYLDYVPVEEDIDVVVHGQLGMFEIKGIQHHPGITCLTKGGFDHTVKAKGLQRLRLILISLEEQPVTIGFDNGWVWIKEAIL
jgi:hypothetical protein